MWFIEVERWFAAPSALEINGLRGCTIVMPAGSQAAG